MPQKQLRPEDRAKLDAYLQSLEDKVDVDPSDEASVDILLTLLESYLPEADGIGKYSDCQKQIYQRFTQAELHAASADSGVMLACLNTCVELLDEYDIYRGNFIYQASQGRCHLINNQYPHCKARLRLFEEQKVISKICLTCYKVQILPTTFASLMTLHFLMKHVRLPRDNARKCMVEFRDYSQYAFKGVIYCESEEEGDLCLDIVREALEQTGVRDIAFGLSHGCTEFGIEYPGYKFAADGSHRDFARPTSWDKQEAQFLATWRPEHVRPDYNTPGITIRDLICFHNWFEYGKLIGDESCENFDCLHTNAGFERLTQEVTPRAEERKAELAALRESLQTSA